MSEVTKWTSVEKVWESLIQPNGFRRPGLNGKLCLADVLDVRGSSVMSLALW